MQGLFHLEEKVAVVTGGTGVLGGVMAAALAKAGAKVAISGRRKDKAVDVALAIEKNDGVA